MPSASHSATIDSPVEAVWRLLIDLESWPRWLRVPYASESVAADSLEPPHVGTEFTLKGKMRFALFARIERLEDLRLLAFEITRSEYPSDRLFFKRARISIELSEVDSGRTRVTCVHWVQGKGLLGRLYMATVFRPFLRDNVLRVVQSIAESV